MYYNGTSLQVNKPWTRLDIDFKNLFSGTLNYVSFVHLLILIHLIFFSVIKEREMDVKCFNKKKTTYLASTHFALM